MFLDFLGPIMHIIDKVLPDPSQKAAAQLAILKLQQDGEFKELDAQLAAAKAQTDINQEEAKNPSVFVSGWRPAIGWVCGLGLATQFLVAPLATWAAALYDHPIAFPSLDMGTLMTLLIGMLGLTAARTTEKINGVAAR